MFRPLLAPVHRLTLLLLMLSALWPMPAAASTIAVAEAPRRCVAVDPIDLDEAPDPADTCRVVAFGRVKGAMPPLLYQLQVWLGDGQAAQTQRIAAGLQVGGPSSNGAGAAVLRPAGKGLLRLVAGAAGRSAVITEPRLVRTAQVPIVVVPAGATISMHPNLDLVFRVVGGRWTEVAGAWMEHVRTPHGVAQRHGNVVDWLRLRAFGAFWKPPDAECCPTGGSYVARLRLDGRHLVLDSIRYYRGDLPFP